jgi:SAM-dependent methyltransferase
MSDAQRLHPLVSGLADAGSYDRGRPRYGEHVVRQLAADLALEPGAPVLELGAGTGQLSRALLAAGLDVAAVEPLPSMRELLARAIGAERVRDGRAERIPLADASVAAVFAADAFHWFDERRAVPEIRRVLRRRGGVAIMRTLPVFDAPWGHELGQILAAERPAHPAFGERGAAAALEEDAGFGPVRERVLDGTHETDRAGILSYVATLSWIGALSASRREEVLERASAVLDAHGVDRVRYPVRHLVWTARLTS